MATTKVLLDAGPLIGFLNRKDQYHQWAVERCAALTDPLWTCEAVLSEAIYNLQLAAFSFHSPALACQPLGLTFHRNASRMMPSTVQATTDQSAASQPWCCAIQP